ncbi:MAG: 30S ribosomal protein S18 [Myxococcales bacterium]|nr:30S ribosomal protein S18 [Myxococcales bacterium]MCB9643821.1 30S ribosomal protein S18 [Myxococcales bacterium]
MLGVRRGGFRKRVRRIRGPIDYKDIDLLSQFITDQGKIMPRRLTRVSAKDQRTICAAIKRARMIGLLPYARR